VSGAGDEARERALRDAEAFVERSTRVSSPGLVPELRLFLADELVPLWESTEAQLEAQGVPPPFWAFAWAGGQALARHVLDAPELVRGKTVLDFACGSGVCGIAAAVAGAREVLFADTDPFAAAAARVNARLNGVRATTTTDDLVGRLDLSVEVVLAGDVCYERPMAERVLGWLRALASTGRTVLLGDPGRKFAPTVGLVELAVHDAPTTKEIEDDAVRTARVWRVLPGV
jgi:predicted nicotinamide N-methyase